MRAFCLRLFFTLRWGRAFWGHCMLFSSKMKPALSRDQNLEIEWSTQNHASRITKADICTHLWQGDCPLPSSTQVLIAQVFPKESSQFSPSQTPLRRFGKKLGRRAIRGTPGRQPGVDLASKRLATHPLGLKEAALKERPGPLRMGYCPKLMGCQLFF